MSTSTPGPRRQALLAEHAAKIDPLELLPTHDRNHRAEQALREHFREMGKRSGARRRERAALLRAVEANLRTLLIAAGNEP